MPAALLAACLSALAIQGTGGCPLFPGAATGTTVAVSHGTHAARR